MEALTQGKKKKRNQSFLQQPVAVMGFLSLSTDKHHRLHSSVIQRIIKVFQTLFVIRGDERKGSYILISVSGNCLLPINLVSALMTFNSLILTTSLWGQTVLLSPFQGPPRNHSSETQGALHCSSWAVCPFPVEGDPVPLMQSVPVTAFGLAALAHPHSTGALPHGAKSCWGRYPWSQLPTWPPRLAFAEVGLERQACNILP